ncbi:hypothetical protein KUCAC02_037691 [Chaenocephalus aceratus]|nr:hypothetical protein KUCAC02_037691 [Chaenocephalus aceratus]
MLPLQDQEMLPLQELLDQEMLPLQDQEMLPHASAVTRRCFLCRKEMLPHKSAGPGDASSAGPGDASSRVCRNQEMLPHASAGQEMLPLQDRRCFLTRLQDQEMLPHTSAGQEMLPLQDQEMLPLQDQEMLPLQDQEMLHLQDQEMLPLQDQEMLPLQDQEMLPHASAGPGRCFLTTSAAPPSVLRASLSQLVVKNSAESGPLLLAGFLITFQSGLRDVHGR